MGKKKTGTRLIPQCAAARPMLRKLRIGPKYTKARQCDPDLYTLKISFNITASLLLSAGWNSGQ